MRCLRQDVHGRRLIVKRFIYAFFLVSLIFSDSSFGEDFINVVEKKRLPADYDKKQDMQNRRYYYFPKHDYGARIIRSRKKLEKIRMDNIEKAMSGTEDEYPLSGMELRDTILTCLNIKFLVERIDNTQLTVYTIKEIDRGSYTEKNSYLKVILSAYLAC